ncbi:MAG TPA: hypothetical protein PK129_05655 [Cellvibrionaceae bacterium]|nr:hypothetical protein [Cellvibrionaceae bacterium]
MWQYYLWKARERLKNAGSEGARRVNVQKKWTNAGMQECRNAGMQDTDMDGHVIVVGESRSSATAINPATFSAGIIRNEYRPFAVSPSIRFSTNSERTKPQLKTLPCMDSSGVK